MMENTVQDATNVAQKLFLKYSKNSTSLQYVDCSPILNESNKRVNKTYNHSEIELKAFFDILDVNKDGYVALQDLEQLCIKYLCPKQYKQLYGNLPVAKKRQPYQEPLKSQMPASEPEIDFRNVQTNVKNKQIFETQFKRPSYGPQIDAQLDIAERLFRHFDTNNSGYLERANLGKLITRTYEIMGIDGFIPSEEDINSWLIMGDRNNIGKIAYPEYEQIVLKSLQNSGLVVQPVEGVYRQSAY